MAIFEPFKLGTWKDREYVVPADEIMRCIAKVEDYVTLFDLAEMRSTGKLRTMQLSQGLAAAMRHAGAEVTAEELYNTLFTGSDAVKFVQRAWTTLHALEILMIPPEHLREPDKPGVKRGRGGRAASSKARTSSRSGSAG
jgi:hypothetical protein